MRVPDRRCLAWVVVCAAVLTLAAAASAVGGYKVGRYSGRIVNPASTISSRISFRVSKAQVLGLMTTDVISVCNNLRPGNLHATGAGGFASIPIRNGSFTVGNVGDSSDFRVSGRLRQGRASGTLRFTARFAGDGVTFDPRGPVICDSGLLRWTAMTK